MSAGNPAQPTSGESATADDDNAHLPHQQPASSSQGADSAGAAAHLGDSSSAQSSMQQENPPPGNHKTPESSEESQYAAFAESAQQLIAALARYSEKSLQAIGLDFKLATASALWLVVYLTLGLFLVMLFWLLLMAVLFAAINTAVMSPLLALVVVATVQLLPLFYCVSQVKRFRRNMSFRTTRAATQFGDVRLGGTREATAAKMKQEGV